MWTLTICLGITWAGCGSIMYRDYPNEDSCYRALKAMQENSQPIAESQKKRSQTAFCSPYVKRA